MVILSIIVGVLMFMILVVLHELGHFTASRKSGVKVLEFGIGLPPKICKLGKDKKGTVYTANWIPLGGFCSLKGEDPTDAEDFNAPDSFMSASFWKKIIILLGGVTANFLVAWIIFTTVFSIGTQPISILPENAIKGQSTSLLMPTYSFLEEQGLLTGEKVEIPLLVQDVSEGSLAAELGIQTGDVFKTINGEKVNVRNVSTILKGLIGQDVNIVYSRDGVDGEVSTHCPQDKCVLGIAFATSGTLDLQPIKFPVHKAMWMGLREIGAQWKLTFSALGSLCRSFGSLNGAEIKDSLNSLSGPVGVIKVGESLIESGAWVLYLAFAGIISLALAIFNVLPIPALDGGRVVGVIIQKVFRIKPEKYFVGEGYVNTVFFILLMILGIYIILKDLVVYWGLPIPFIG